MDAASQSSFRTCLLCQAVIHPGGLELAVLIVPQFRKMALKSVPPGSVGTTADGEMS